MNTFEDLRKQWKILKDLYQQEKKKLFPPSGSGADALPKSAWPFYSQVINIDPVSKLLADN